MLMEEAPSQGQGDGEESDKPTGLAVCSPRMPSATVLERECAEDPSLWGVGHTRWTQSEQAVPCARSGLRGASP